MQKKFSISIDNNALRQYPYLDKLQRQLFPISALNEVMNALENRREGFRLELVYNVLKVFLINVNREGNDDYLGLLKVDGPLKDICDVIRETTTFGAHAGIDPRTQIYYSKKSSILHGTNLTEDALIAPNYVPARGERKRHPLDLVSTEEVVLRRQLANQRWEQQKKEQRERNKRLNTSTRKIENAKDFFDGRGDKR